MAVPAMIIDGDVIAAHSSWTDDGSRIVTEATVMTSDGQQVVVSQLGGSVGGIGMIQMPGPAMLEPGMHVAVAAHKDLDLAQQEHVVLDSVRVLTYPPEFVRTGPTKAGHYLHWASAHVSVTVDAAGTVAIPGDQAFAIIDAALDTWNKATINSSCSYLAVTDAGRKSLEVGNDGKNLIKIRDLMWGRPATGSDPARSYSPSAAGITTATYIDDGGSRDGEIVDADIEINGVDFAISAGGVSNSEKACHAELQNTLTHELGHLHGLEHPCLAGGDPPRVDDMGAPVPSCSSALPAKILDATMYNFQDCGETKKETLSDDDIESMCKIYPAGMAPGGGCCSASGGSRPDASLILAGATVLLLRRRRRLSREA
ncbi:MAG TPA: hypothetical protein VF469_11300 [Kofleriaceae bacterium]